MSTPAPERTATFREVFAVREFRAMYGTFLVSAIGDELARVALTVLVYQRTSSPLLSAITFGISYLPWLVGGPLLSTLADRLPRHRVLIASDVGRAVVVATMAIPGMPLPLLLGLLLLVSLASPPFESARSALTADVLEGDRYAVGTSLTGISLQLAQVIGFLGAGVLLMALSPSVALLIDAATFAFSALWLSVALQRRPAPMDGSAAGPGTVWQQMAEGFRFIRGTPRLLAIIAVLWVGTLFANGPEGIATPLVDELGGGAVWVGVLLAANPLGATIGGLVIGRFVRPSLRERLVPTLVVLSVAPMLAAGLLAAVAGPGTLSFAVVVGLLFVAGFGQAWSIPLNVSFVQSVPAAYRGRAFGVAVTGLYGMQGLGVLAVGLAAEGLAPSVVVALCGGLGVLAVLPPVLAYVRTQGHVAAPAAAEGASVA